MRQQLSDANSRNDSLVRENEDLRRENLGLRDELRRKEAEASKAIVLLTVVRDSDTDTAFDLELQGTVVAGYVVFLQNLCIQYRLAGVTAERCATVRQYLQVDSSLSPSGSEMAVAVEAAEEREAVTLACWRMATVGEPLPSRWR